MQGVGGNRFAKLAADQMFAPAGNSELGKPTMGQCLGLSEEATAPSIVHHLIQRCSLVASLVQ